jgi:hypothetical protein
MTLPDFETGRSKTDATVWPVWLLLLLGLATCLGCERNRPPRRVMRSDERKMAIHAGQDHLDRVFDFIDTFHRYPEREIIPRIHYHLAEWSKTQSPDDDWIADPMFGRLPKRLHLTNRPATLSRLDFSDADLVMLREAMWIHDIASRVASREVSDPHLAAWLEDEGNGLEPTQVRDLRYVIECFDWVIRNIQLEGPDVGASLAEACGIEPPPEGTFRTSWESLLIGRGEAANRMRIMILLCRQLNVPAVVLAIEPPDGSSGDATAWAVGALVGQDLFLFDPQLGLPIPGQARLGIATLSQVIDTPALLDALNLGSRKYPINADDLGRVVALIDATIPYLSQRMTLLERRLAGDRKIRLTVSPSSLAQELRKCKGVTNVAIWPLPYDVMNYRRSHLQNESFMARLFASVQPFSGNTALANGRRLHIAGKWSSDPPEKGAKAYYLECRVPDAEIARPRFDASLREILDLPAGPLPDNPEFLRQLESVQSARLRFFKRHASYWLGLIAFEQQKFPVAVDYLQTRTLEANPGGAQEDGARYCLARVFEAQGLRDKDPQQLERAIELYESDDSPQATGNKIRAKWLKESL